MDRVDWDTLRSRLMGQKRLRIDSKTGVRTDPLDDWPEWIRSFADMLDFRRSSKFTDLIIGNSTGIALVSKSGDGVTAACGLWSDVLSSPDLGMELQSAQTAGPRPRKWFGVRAALCLTVLSS